MPVLAVTAVGDHQDPAWACRKLFEQIGSEHKQFVNLGRDTWAVRYMMNLDHDEQPLFVADNQLEQLTTLPRPSWVIVPRKEAALLKGTSMEQQAPSFEGRLNDNPLMVFLLK